MLCSPRAVWAIGAFIGEYDVPQCKPGTPMEDCKHEIWGVVSTPKQYVEFFVKYALKNMHRTELT